jgi:lipopolysaccharide biosynthesis regulator YciM
MPMRHHRALPVGTAAAIALLAGLAAPAIADPIDNIGRRLDGLSAEVSRLAAGVQNPGDITRSSADLIGRKILEAQANFGVANYDDAALILYDVVERSPGHARYPDALYYLAESLFQKGDTVASRAYFTRLVEQRGDRSKFYRQSLERLIELSMQLGDTKHVDGWLKALDAAPASEQSSSVPYVRGKYYYFSKDYDRAIVELGKVASRSRYSLQARYFLGVAHTAKGDLVAASRVFQQLVNQPARGADAKRIVELAHMALGRLYYERNQPSKAIDAYLDVDRRSELFPDALFEAAWVYVKNQEYNKALRALELLALSDPKSYRMPEVRILEANLRIRRAQKLEEDGGGNPEEEYARATQLFAMTKNAFEDPHAALKKILAEGQDPRLFLEQITGRHSSAFETQSQLPEVAAAWLRLEPEVKRIVAVEDDLSQIQTEIDEAEKVVQRLELALNSPSRFNIFPSLAAKRVRGTEILEEILDLRGRLASSASQAVPARGAERAELARLSQARQAIERQLTELPGSGQRFGARLAAARNRFVALENRAAQAAALVHFTEAQLVAIERYVASGAPSLEAADRSQVDGDMAALRAELEAMVAELDDIRREASLAKDMAGSADGSDRSRALRRQLRSALDAETRYLVELSRKDPGARRAVAQLQKAGKLTAAIDNMFGRIESLVDAALAEVRSDLGIEKAKLAAYKQEFVNYEQESAGLGSEILGGSFENVAGKFYQILIETDVGAVDVAWSRQEESDRRQRRLTLDQARELRTLDTEFSEILREIKEENERDAKEEGAAPSGEQQPPPAPEKQPQPPPPPPEKAGQP